ncbi:MAG: glycosyltransferase [Schwartzia succinivorans]|uniref:glycosyltransferase family 2 protein n=1 Tax=Schwartzia succinivorans TaxID=55507 RepID=UPI00235741CC|nr:glycosyltransferase [Schwartzia succinivorans]MBE6096684.1 glycosyltransferase [Schwartzia succinivorans]
MASIELISIIICETDEKLTEGFLNELQRLEIPEGTEVDVQIVRAAEGNLAAAYNEGIRQSRGKYKFFIDESARFLNEGLLWLVVRELKTEKIGMVGLFGSEMPLDGNFAKSRKWFGRYAIYTDEKEQKASVMYGDNPLWHQKVHCLDGRFIAVSEDIEWDESVGDEFAAAALCMRYRNAGYDCIVPMQDAPWMAFDKPSLYSLGRKDPNFRLKAKCFFDKYWDTVQPLVSILIPTYNQPKFFEKALRSALAQDYRNIEIVVGDDSTNEETKELLECNYLKKYPQIRYFYHGGPLGEHGLKNIEFVLDHAEGEFISHLFHDDLYYPTKISRMMTCYEEDLSEQLGIVTSSRDLIDENDNVINRFNPWQPVEDTVLTGEQVGTGIFSNMANFIGELTTVLLRKNFLRQEKGEHLYRVSMYCGVRDTELADVSTFLEMCRTGRCCMFLKDRLSAFRVHSEQNTWKLNVVLGALMEWLDYIVLSWLNNTYIHTKEQLINYLSIWYPWAVEQFNRVVKQHEGEPMPETYIWIRALFEKMGENNYEEAVNLSISYMMNRAEDKEALMRVCRKNERGLWCKR